MESPSFKTIAASRDLVVHRIFPMPPNPHRYVDAIDTKAFCGALDAVALAHTRPNISCPACLASFQRKANRRKGRRK